MEQITSYEQLEQDIREHVMLLAYFSGPDCGVCTAIKPKVLELLEAYPKIASRYIDVSTQNEAAAQHSIFTLPGILLFVQGKESIREARYVHMDGLRGQIDRIYSMLFA